MLTVYIERIVVGIIIHSRRHGMFGTENQTGAAGLHVVDISIHFSADRVLVIGSQHAHLQPAGKDQFVAIFLANRKGTF